MNIKKMVMMTLFTALIIIGSYLTIPIEPVPIALGSLFVFLAALLLPPSLTAGAVLLYLFLGAVGLPVFAGGTGGIAVFMGPSAGFLFAYLPAAFLAGLISWKKDALLTDILAVVAGTFFLYAAGVPWLKINLGLDWKTAFAAGMTPFLIGDALKAVVAVTVSRFFKSRIKEFISRER